jgi:glycosyltransferase involved in cell wall biosynthesis
MITNRKIKVLRIINRFNIGGPTYNAAFLSKYISDDFETLLVGGLPEKDESDSLYILKEHGLTPLLLHEMKRKPDFFSDRKAYLKIKQLIRDFNPDIVHTHASKAGALGRKAAFELNVPIIVHTYHGHVFHSYFGTLKTQLFKLIERQLAKKTTGIIAISKKQKVELTDIHAICKPEKVAVIPLGFDLLKFHENREINREITRAKYGLSKDEIAIAIIGRLAPIKNHTLFLQVVQRVSEQTTKKLTVFIVGDGEEKKHIEAQIRSLQCADSIRFVLTSWIVDIGAFNAGMDIICLTSNNEGTPVSLIEAQAGSIPVISTDVGGVRDIVWDGVTGFVVPKNCVNSFAEKLLFLVENNEKRLEMAQKGWFFVEKQFHYLTLVKNMEDYYRTLLMKLENDA